MYTTSYNDEGSGISIPDGYGGTLLGEADAPKEEEATVETGAGVSEGRGGGGIFSGLFGGLPQRLLDGGIFRDFKLGTEELLIIAAAAFLFFTKGGDKECAAMLILLLFIK